MHVLCYFPLTGKSQNQQTGDSVRPAAQRWRFCSDLHSTQNLFMQLQAAEFPAGDCGLKRSIKPSDLIIGQTLLLPIKIIIR